jgi:streptogramin lyase
MSKTCAKLLAGSLVVLSADAAALESFRYSPGHVESNLTIGPDHNIWFGSADGIGHITPAGESQIFPIGVNLDFIIIASGADGNLWTIANYTLFVVTPFGTVVHTFNLPQRDYDALTLGSDGRMWLSSYYDAAITAIDVDGTVTDYTLPVVVGATAKSSDGTLWATSYGQILRLGSSGLATSFELPREGSATLEVETIAAAQDGKMLLATNILGCPFSPCIYLGASLVTVNSDGTSVIHQTPDSAETSALSAVFGGDGNAWLLARRINSGTYNYDSLLLRVTPDGTFTSYLLPEYEIARSAISDVSGNLWIADDDDQITEIILPADLVFSDKFDFL